MRNSSPWRPTRWQWFLIGLAAIAAGSTLGYVVGTRCDGVGVGQCMVRTGWAWVGLLAVPIVTAGVAFWLNGREKQVGQLPAAAESVPQDESTKPESPAVPAVRQEDAVRAYLASMAPLARSKQGDPPPATDEAKRAARERTLAILLDLDGEQKGAVIRFLHEAHLIDKDAPIVRLEGADLLRVRLSGADLARANLTRASLTAAHLVGTHFEYAVLWKTELTGAHLEQAHLEGAFLTGAVLEGAFLTGAVLTGAFLEGAILEGAFLEGAILEGTSLEGASLRRADLQRAHLSRANLSGADLTGANLSEADLTGATVTPEQLAACRSLEKATLPDGSRRDASQLGETNAASTTE